MAIAASDSLAGCALNIFIPGCFFFCFLFYGDCAEIFVGDFVPELLFNFSGERTCLCGKMGIFVFFGFAGDVSHFVGWLILFGYISLHFFAYFSIFFSFSKSKFYAYFFGVTTFIFGLLPFPNVGICFFYLSFFFGSIFSDSGVKGRTKLSFYFIAKKFNESLFELVPC